VSTDATATALFVFGYPVSIAVILRFVPVVRERHGEQIEHLEELVRELVRTAESLRRATATPLDGRAD